MDGLRAQIPLLRKLKSELPRKTVHCNEPSQAGTLIAVLCKVCKDNAANIHILQPQSPGSWKTVSVQAGSATFWATPCAPCAARAPCGNSCSGW